MVVLPELCSCCCPAAERLALVLVDALNKFLSSGRPWSLWWVHHVRPLQTPLHSGSVIWC